MHEEQSRHPSSGIAATARGQKTWRTRWALPGSFTDSNAATGRRRDDGGTEAGAKRGLEVFMAPSSGGDKVVTAAVVCETRALAPNFPLIIGAARAMTTSFLELALTVFGVVFVAELPDKTALAALVLASRNAALPVLLGSAAALAVQSAIAVAAGQLVSLLPSHVVHLVSGGVFVISAVVMWFRKPDEEKAREEEDRKGFWRTAWLVFVVVFLAEWGDLTQIATAALAARYAAPLAVFVGATAALWSVSALAVVVGNRAGKLLSPRVTQRVAAVAFAVVGVALLVGVV